MTEEEKALLLACAYPIVERLARRLFDEAAAHTRPEVRVTWATMHESVRGQWRERAHERIAVELFG